MDDTREQFILDRESKYSGKIIHQTFVKLIGVTNSTHTKKLNGTLYIINNKIIFEDFEPQISPLITYGNKPSYTKSEIIIDINTIKRVGIIPCKYSDELLTNPKLLENLKTITRGLKSFFISTDLYIKLSNDDLYIFNFLDNFKELDIIKKSL